MTERNPHAEIMAFTGDSKQDDAELKRRLRNADASDFQILDQGGTNYPYVASFYGCFDLAKFRRKADCERFIKTFKRRF
jgi:hypothetical protein